MRLSRHTPLAEASDELLMELVVFGKQEALRELYDRYFKLLCRFAHGFVKDEAQAEDAVQEVFITIMRKADSYKPDKKFRTWMLSLCANHCKNLLRNEANRGRIMQEKLTATETSMELNHSLDRAKLKEEIARMLESCSAKENELYHLRFEMDLNVKEIAQILEIPEGSVKSGLFYLIKKLRVPLKALYHEYR
ncbi:MAG: sigma-70 family RNA polymerase sigma factor [Bacteroidetes bacterium]|nr:MAG: sigma-70 family RNA polymerase sigma factor [Bacteroidota bacterium]